MRSRPGATTVSRLAAVLAVLALVACAGEVASQDDRETEIYDAALAWVLAQPGLRPEGEVPLVYVEHLGAATIDLPVQVDLIGRFDDDVELRFVDARTEAVDESLVGLPVRDGLILVGLGPITEAAEAAEVRVEVYVDADHVTAYRFRVVEVGEGWVLDGEPEPIEPEGLVTEP